MKSILRNSLIAITCVLLAGCFGSKKKNKSSRRSRTISSVKTISGFEAYKSGKTISGTLVSSSIEKDFPEDKYSRYEACMQSAVSSSSTSKSSPIADLITGEASRAILSCCEEAGGTVESGVTRREFLARVQAKADFTIDDLYNIFGALRGSSLLPLSSTFPPEKHSITGHVFSGSLWDTHTGKYYSHDILSSFDSSMVLTTPLSLGSSRPASQGSQWYVDGGIIGPDLSTLTGLFAADQSIESITSWYRSNFHSMPNGVWLEPFVDNVYSRVFLDTIACQSDSDSLRKSFYEAQPNAEAFRMGLSVADRDFFCVSRQQAVTNFANQVLWTGVCKV